MNRIDRLSAIIIQLQSRTQVRAQQIADRFGISLRTVYRDMKALEESGIPIVGNPGIGYSLMEGFKLPPLMFTQEEALSFLIAEKLIRELTDADSSKQFQSGIEKIKAVMRCADKSALETIENNIAVLKTNKPEHYMPDVLLDLLKNIHQKRRVDISYLVDTTSMLSCRSIEAVGLFFSRTNWYVIAYCLQKKAYRTFRVDRLQEIRPSHEAYMREHPSLSHLLADFHNTSPLHDVVIRIRKEHITRMSDDKYYYGLTSEEVVDEMVECKFRTYSLGKFAHWYLSYADVATVVKPDKLKEQIRDIIKKISI